jgi:hypothetical protein
MPRKKATPPVVEQPIAAAPRVAEAVEMPKALTAPDASANEVKSQATPERKLSDLPDPRALMIATLGPSNSSPKMHLLRSFKYRQMQISFEQEPEDKYKLMLKEAGWRDRTEEEGIWTKQIPRDSGWQPAADAERLFKQIANEIRAERGLGAHSGQLRS